MTTARQKGMNFQRWICAFLEKQGYACENFTPSATQRLIRGKMLWISKRNDPFGCLDIIALKLDDYPRFIQATLHKSRKEKEKKFFANDIWNTGFANIEIWMKRESGQVDIYRMDWKFNEKKGHGEKLFIHHAKIIRGKYFELKREE